MYSNNSILIKNVPILYMPLEQFVYLKSFSIKLQQNQFFFSQKKHPEKDFTNLNFKILALFLLNVNKKIIIH